MKETLEDLYKIKEETTDQRELRKIRARIRKHLRATGQYVSREEKKERRGKLKEKRTRTEENSDRALARWQKIEREKKAGDEAEKFWKSLVPLHCYVCGCSKCSRTRDGQIKHLTPPFKAWWTIMKRRGLKVDKKKVRPAYLFLQNGGKPTKDWTLLFRELLKASGWL